MVTGGIFNPKPGLDVGQHLVTAVFCQTGKFVQKHLKSLGRGLETLLFFSVAPCFLLGPPPDAHLNMQGLLREI